MIKKTLIASALLTALCGPQAFASDETQELRKIIEQQQKILKDLERRLAETEKRQQQTAERVEQTAERVEQTAEVVDATPQKTATTIGGYGELHYNNIDNKLGEDKKEFDFHRFVLFFGHEFTENTRFFSELEVEHSISGDGQNGEVELEQAYIEHDFNQALTAKAGLFLMPVGIINETHEPPAFYGVERNPVEKDILPATWWEAGLAMNIQALPDWPSMRP